MSPACNIRCQFCRLRFNAQDQRPGVARTLVSPEQVLAKVERALELCPQISVVGIAGPGDSLATPHALEALRAIGRRFPDLIACLSTNGLALPERADELWDTGVRVLTITVNAVDPHVLEQICTAVRWQGHTLRGTAGAEVLIHNQLAGLELLARRGAFIKVNTVLVPGVNDHHVAEVARAVATRGAQRINVIPLLADPELAPWAAPSCDQLAAARDVAEAYLPVFRHCQHCRADACGIPAVGRDFGAELYPGAESAEATFSHG